MVCFPIQLDAYPGRERVTGDCPNTARVSRLRNDNVDGVVDWMNWQLICNVTHTRAVTLLRMYMLK